MGTLDCIYFFLFALGVGYALIAALLGGLAHFHFPGMDVHTPDVDLHPDGLDLHPGDVDSHVGVSIHHDLGHEVDHPDVRLSPLSPITIATFVATFGGVGLIVNNLTQLSPVLGLLISTLSGMILAGVMFLVYTRVLGAAQGSSEVRAGELVGRTAEVLTPIPVGEGKLGEVTLVARGTYLKSPARSTDGQAIPRGATVEIVGEAGSVLVVRATATPVPTENS